jgi:acyl carrier protein
MTRGDVELQVRTIIARESGCNLEEVTLTQELDRDLRLDSLDTFEIVMAIEDEFSIEIPDREAEQVFTDRVTVLNVIDHVAKRLEAS